MTERARIRRGAAPRGGAKSPAIARRGASVAKATRKAVASRAVATIPLPAERLKAIWRWFIAAVIAAGAAAALWVAGVPAMIGEGLGALGGAAGLTVRHCDIVGSKHLDRLSICAMMVDRTNAMLLVDLGAVRREFLKNPWVADARVSRRLPDTVLVDIVERRPAAVWQQAGRLALIDASGVVLGPVDPRAMPDLPVIVGAGANGRAGALEALIDTVPRLKPLVAGATWVGGRRWDLRFQSGELLALPEGDAAARDAFMKFDRADQATRLLGQGFVRFDMRIPGKFVVRVSREPGAEVPHPGVPGTPPAPAGTDAV